jgi:hypothetical protein
MPSSIFAFPPAGLDVANGAIHVQVGARARFEVLRGVVWIDEFLFCRWAFAKWVSQSSILQILWRRRIRYVRGVRNWLSRTAGVIVGPV